MKSIRILALTLCLSTLAVPATTFAAKGEKKGKGAGKVVKQYDTNANGMIDGSEVDAFRKAFDADKTGPLKQFDTDANGTLSDGEIAAVKAGKGGKKKKNQ